MGLNISFEEQPSPDGLAQAFIIGKKFIKNDSVCLVLGDNIFYGDGIKDLLNEAKNRVEIENKATVFGYYVDDPERYGVAEFDNKENVISIEEKPKKPKSNYAVVGLYFYPNSVIKIAENIKPSNRGELEITSVNKEYLNKSQLTVKIMGKGYKWLDTGTHESLADAGEFVRTTEKNKNLKIGCLEEICFEQNFISKDKAIKLGNKLSKTDYGKYILNKVKIK